MSDHILHTLMAMDAIDAMIEADAHARVDRELKEKEEARRWEAQQRELQRQAQAERDRKAEADRLRNYGGMVDPVPGLLKQKSLDRLNADLLEAGEYLFGVTMSAKDQIIRARVLERVIAHVRADAKKYSNDPNRIATNDDLYSERVTQIYLRRRKEVEGMMRHIESKSIVHRRVLSVPPLNGLKYVSNSMSIPDWYKPDKDVLDATAFFNGPDPLKPNTEYRPPRAPGFKPALEEFNTPKPWPEKEMGKREPPPLW